MSATRVLVTGGGFLGTALADRLLRTGHRVRVLDLRPPRPEWQARVDQGELEWETGNVAAFEDVARALRGCDRVVHLAALLTPDCREDPLRGAQVNLLGTLHVFEAARRAGLSSVAYAGSAGVFGPDTAAHPAPTTLYGTWKLAAEGIARAYWADHGLASVGLRPFVVYGAGRESGLSSGPSLACRAAARGEAYEIPFTGRTGLVYVDDVVSAFAAAVEPRRRGAFVFNLPGVIASMDEVIAEVRRQVPGARLSAGGAPLPIAADLAPQDLAPVLGEQPVTSLAGGIAATLAACRAG